MRLLPIFLTSLLPTLALAQTSSSSASPEALVDKFSKIHQDLMPIVAVADMFYGCNEAQGNKTYEFSELINSMDKDVLADNLVNCLGDDNLASDKALNFGIKACFTDQLSQLPKQEQQEKLNQVDQIIASLPRNQRQRSFTQCVNNQTLKYIK